MDLISLQSVTPDNSEFLKWLATLGVGGILAAFMFHFYRQDVKQYTEAWKGQSEALMQVVKENTASNTRLVASVDSLQVLLSRYMTDGLTRRRDDNG